MQKKITIEPNTIIAAVSTNNVDMDLLGNVKMVFILASDILSVNKWVETFKNHNKAVFIHADLIDGLGKDYHAIEYIAKKIRPDGIISTRNNLLKKAKELNLMTVQRVFMLDSLSFERGIKGIQSFKPDFVEVMPGIAPTAIASLKERIHQPIIAGGLIKTAQDVEAAFNAGAVAVSSSNQALWVRYF